MTDYQLLALKTAIESREIAEAIEAAMQAEANERVSQLRQQVRSGNAVEAARVEGQIETLEAIVPILQKYAAQYRITRVA